MPSLTSSLQTSTDLSSGSSLPLSAVYNEVSSFVAMLLADYPGSGSIAAYFAARAQHEGAVKQDLLPLLVFMAIDNRGYGKAIPLAAAWGLHLAAAHLVDEAQDRGNLANVHDSVLALGAANVALAQLDSDEDALRDLLDAMGQVAILSIHSQRGEQNDGSIRSRTEYFRSIAGKAAAIIATGIWLGGRLATDDAQTLTALKEFGLALGMAIQLSDDCFDLAEDLSNGIFTLPVIEAMALVDHPQHDVLARLLDQGKLPPAAVRQVIHILAEMGAVAACERIIRAYQIQAAAAFAIFPGLGEYFSNYVAVRNE